MRSADDGGVQKQADDGGVQKQTERGGFVFAAVFPDMMLMLYSWTIHIYIYIRYAFVSIQNT